jgi:hypothetical protein
LFPGGKHADGFALAGAAGLRYGGGVIMRTLLLLPALTLIAACGNLEPLQPKAASGMPPKPAMAARAPTTDELLAVPPQAAPPRQDDGLRRSEERADDPFDLPPTG